MPEQKCRNCCVGRERTHQFPSAQLSLQQQQGGWSVHEALMKKPRNVLEGQSACPSFLPTTNPLGSGMPMLGGSPMEIKSI